MVCRALVVSLVLAAPVGCGEGDDDPFIGGPDDNYGGVVEGPNGPIEGAMVTTLGSSAQMTTTNSSGLFALALADGETTILVEAAAHWGSQQRIRIASPQRILDAEIELASETEVAEVEADLGIAIDESRGVVAMPFFSNGLDMTGAGGTITAVSDSPYTFNMDDVLVPSPVLLQNGTEAELVFLNASVGPTSAAGTGTSTVICATEFDTTSEPFELRAKVVTEIRIFCANAI